MTAIAPNVDDSNFWVGSGGTATSDVASRLRVILFDQTVPNLRQADTWNRLGDSIDLLREVYLECAMDNWDGYSAKAVTAGAYEEAITLLNSLPHHVPLPELEPEPDGSIGFEWENGANRVFALSVNGKGTIVYAGILGKGNKAHGTEVFNDSLPEGLVGHIQRIFS